MKSQYFLIGKELYESFLIFPKLWLILLFVIWLLLIRYLILSQILLNNLESNNSECLILPATKIINPSI